MTDRCSRCASALEDDALVCLRCGGETGTPDGTPQQEWDSSEDVKGSTESQGTVPAAPMFATGTDLEGIRGWLILVAVGLGIGPLVSLSGAIRDLLLLYGAKYQSTLAARPGVAGLVLYEAVTNSIFFVALVALNFLFYKKRKSFPALMITFLGSQLALVLIDHLAARALQPSTGLAGVLRSLVGAVIWIPYYLRSERVKATFVN